jgi:PAS domain S-box-containing protein
VTYSDGELVGIRFNQIIGLFDRSPLATAICHADGLAIRVANPAFAEALGMARTGLKGMSVFDLMTSHDDAAVRRLHEAIDRRANGRREVPVGWSVDGSRSSGRISFELVDDTLLGDVPLLTYLHVDRRNPQAPPEIEPIASRILELIAAGETTSAIARAVDLTVDGVNYHVARLCRRLGAANRTAVVARAYVIGVLDVAAWPPRAAEPDSEFKA